MRQANTPAPVQFDKLKPDEDIVHTISNNGVMYDVGSSHPGGEEAPKGLAVRQLKRHASWVSVREPSINLLITVKPSSSYDIMKV